MPLPIGWTSCGGLRDLSRPEGAGHQRQLCGRLVASLPIAFGFRHDGTMRASSNQVLRFLTSGSPKIVCCRCERGFIYASMRVNTSLRGMTYLCPWCREPGPFRAASPSEAQSIQPEVWHWWIVVPLLLLFVGVPIMAAINMLK